MSAPPDASRSDRRALVTAGTVLGIGLGGFADGILFHQILQLHNLLSAVYPPNTLVNVEFNMIWDGLFHAFTWATTVLGVVLVWRAARAAREPWADRTLLGASLLGWGVFNLVEGTIDHFVLQIHHVVERLGLSVWDGVFLASGLALIAAGVAILRSAPGASAAPVATGRVGRGSAA
jgi:uncharacterized membrane protein